MKISSYSPDYGNQFSTVYQKRNYIDIQCSPLGSRSTSRNNAFSKLVSSKDENQKLVQTYKLPKEFSLVGIQYMDNLSNYQRKQQEKKSGYLDNSQRKQSEKQDISEYLIKVEKQKLPNIFGKNEQFIQFNKNFNFKIKFLNSSVVKSQSLNKMNSYLSARSSFIDKKDIPAPTEPVKNYVIKGSQKTIKVRDDVFEYDQPTVQINKQQNILRSTIKALGGAYINMHIEKEKKQQLIKKISPKNFNSQKLLKSNEDTIKNQQNKNQDQYFSGNETLSDDEDLSSYVRRNVSRKK